jgi:hypothetical protein
MRHETRGKGVENWVPIDPVRIQMGLRVFGAGVTLVLTRTRRVAAQADPMELTMVIVARQERG